MKVYICYSTGPLGVYRDTFTFTSGLISASFDGLPISMSLVFVLNGGLDTTYKLSKVTDKPISQALRFKA
jgi:hypothetical protein